MGEVVVTGRGAVVRAVAGRASLHPPLHAQLFTSGRRFLDAAIRAYGRGEREVFALHAGVALEHLMKARLASINPLLILDWDRKPTIEALMWLADETKHGQRPPKSLRTVGAERAAEFLGARVGLAQYGGALARLRDQRNGIGHFGSADLDGLADLLPSILAAAAHLVEGLTDDPADVFGVHREFAATQLREWGEAEERDLAGRLAEAQRVLDEKHPHLTEDVRAAMRTALNDLLDDQRWTGIQVTDCPVCGFPAAIKGELSLDADVNYGRDGEIDGGGVFGVFAASELRCTTCDLVLDSPSLVKRSGAMEGFEVPWDDVQALADYESEQSWRAWEAAGFPGRDEHDDEDEGDEW